jgi:hypothetical protein
MPLALSTTQAYPAVGVAQCWRGVNINDADEFDVYLRGPVWDRVNDAEFEADLAQDLQALATTDMATQTLESLLNAVVTPQDWEIGEAMAECLLSDEIGAVWPWNENRDRKTPKASLPGADIVGFIGEGEDTTFLFGEVKTSSHADNPPGVMNGRSGLAHQIDTLATTPSHHFTLIKWLSARCTTEDLRARFRTAAKRYLASEGKDFAIAGVLLRDTAAHQDDLRTRGQTFGAGPDQPRIRLDAWYTPRPITDWVNIASTAA